MLNADHLILAKGDLMIGLFLWFAMRYSGYSGYSGNTVICTILQDISMAD